MHRHKGNKWLLARSPLIIFCIVFTSIILMPYMIFASDREAYESAKEAFQKINSSFSEVKNKVDETYNFFARFHNGITTWRNAVSKETQNMGIEEIDKLADDKIEAVVDTLFEKAKASVGVPDEFNIPEAMKQKAIEKLREKFKGKIPPRIANRLGYMYTLSAIDRRLREGYIYENLKYVKDGFDKGSKLLGNFNNAIKFIDTFSPQSAESNPVGRLVKVKDFLVMIADISKPIPLMGDIINGYAKTTEGFMVALNDLDNKLKDARYGSLCGQRGVDTDIQNAFQKSYPSEDCLTYLALSNSQYPHINPIRAWEGGERSKVFLWLNGEGTLLTGSNFQIMYRLFSALKESYRYNKIANHERLFNLMKAAQTSNLYNIAEQFNNYYKKFEKDFRFKEALEMDGLYKGGNLISLNGSIIDYQFGSTPEEFAGLCLFNSRFRNDVKAIYEKYVDSYVINGTIKTEIANVTFAGISVFIDNQPVRELKCAEQCSFRHLVFKDSYNINVIADGFKDIKKTYIKENYPFITLSLASMKIESDKNNVTIGERVALTAIIEGRVAQGGKFYWSINGKPYGGNTNRTEFIPSQAGVHKINVTISDDKGRAMLQAQHSINVIERLTLFIQGPSEVQKGIETSFVAQLKEGIFTQSQGKYSYTWSLNGQKYGGNDNFIKTKFDKEGNYSIKATLWQWIKEQNRWQKISEASHYLVVKPPQAFSLGMTVTGPSTGYVGNEFVFYANIEDVYKLRDLLKDNQPKIAFSWLVNNRPFGGHESPQKIRFDSAGKHTISVVAWVWSPTDRKWLKISEGRHYFESFERQYADRGYTPKPTPIPIPTPTLTPKPSPTLTPIPTPTLTPKPSPTLTPTATATPRIRQFSELSPQEQQNVLNCLCRCNSTATSSVSVYYETKPVSASPHCNDTANGPCVNQGFGCWRHVPQNTGSCAERCYKSSNVQSVPNNYMKVK